jgi:hypothetical protein
MDPLSAMVISVMEENTEIQSLLDFMDYYIRDCEAASKNIQKSIQERTTPDFEELEKCRRDIGLLQDSISRAHERKFGEKFEWSVRFL